MPWMPISTIAFELTIARGVSAENEEAARLELLADLASGIREAAGITKSGAIETIPRHFWAYAELGEELEWADRDPFVRHQGEVVVDFRCDAIGAWDANKWGASHGGYRTLYSDIRVSPAVVNTVAMPVSAAMSEQPGPKPGIGSGKNKILKIAEDILQCPDRPPLKHGWQAQLAREVKARLEIEGLKYETDSIRRYLTQHKISHPG